MDFLRNALQTITTCCLNCREDSTRPASRGEPTERTALLIEQQRRNIANSPQIRRISEDDINEYASSFPKRDEQTALNRIVQETNS